MKTLTQTIIVIVAISLLAAGVVEAMNVSDEEIQAVELQIKQAELEQQSRAEVAATPAQIQANRSAAPVPVPRSVQTPPTPPTPAPVTAVNNDIYSLTRGVPYGSRSTDADPVLLIPSAQISTEEIITINEDMSVMSRIFQKNLEQARISTARSSIFASRHNTLAMLIGGSSQIQSMYLQGYGALFLLKVDFPLSPAPKASEEEKETEKAEEGDPVWQEMRREIYEPENVDRRRRTAQPEGKYDAEKVENLKTTLIKALKHAANIRSLKPDESVILTVTGSSEATGRTITASRIPGGNQIIITERDADGKMKTSIVQGTSLDDIGSSSPTILVIRVKKSQINEFASGQVDFDRFRQSVQVLTYPLLSGATGSLGYGM